MPNLNETDPLAVTEPETTPRISHKPILITILAVLMLGLVFYSAYNLFVPYKTPEVIVRIKPGETTKHIASSLKLNKIVRSSLWFRGLVRLTGSDRQLKAGRYVFGGDVSLWETIAKIREGRSTLLHLTIPEGFSLYKTVKLMEHSGIAPADSLLALATDPVFCKRLTGLNINTLEGFLYPETYAFDIDLDPQQIYELMVKQFFARLERAGITTDDFPEFYKTLILASIVEQEAVKEEEKPLIAGVFLNRIKKNMKLESCPTVDYTLERQGIQRKQLTYADLLCDTPYNTYKINGLPPNPICNPSISSLQAVLNPEVTQYLYFFADFKGNNVFSTTYAEHVNKQKMYQQ